MNGALLICDTILLILFGVILVQLAFSVSDLHASQDAFLKTIQDLSPTPQPAPLPRKS